MLLFHSLVAAPSEEFLVLRSRSYGMFCIFQDVITALYTYEHDGYAGVEIDFAKTGFYYDPTKGPNWWNYYFEPISLGKSQAPHHLIVYGDHSLFGMWRVEKGMTREEVCAYVTKYIHVRPSIQSTVDRFVNKKFKGYYVIGIHYRGTDKVVEAPRTSYASAKAEIDKQLSQNQDKKCRIFVATDEQQFLDYLKECYGNKVIYDAEATRSTNGKPKHENPLSPYAEGKHALIDCLLLSKTDILLRTSSNLSMASTFFNLNLPVIELSRRY